MLKAKAVEKASPSLNLDYVTLTYNGAAQSYPIPTGTADPYGDGKYTVTYKKGGAAVTAPKDAGTYDVTVTHPASATLGAFSKTITGGLTIKQKDLTVAMAIALATENTGSTGLLPTKVSISSESIPEYETFKSDLTITWKLQPSSGSTKFVGTGATLTPASITEIGGSSDRLKGGDVIFATVQASDNLVLRRVNGTAAGISVDTQTLTLTELYQVTYKNGNDPLKSETVQAVRFQDGVGGRWKWRYTINHAAPTAPAGQSFVGWQLYKVGEAT